MLAHEIVASVKRRSISPTEVTKHYLERIARLDPQIRAFLRVNPAALGEAQQVEQRLSAGEELPLAGVPIALKDNICTHGLETTCASRMLERFVPPYNATVVERLRQAGAVILGKTNLDEFAMGSSTEFSAFGPTRNPWDLGRVPGGSSGGSAAAVAADLAPLALGSDTGGSVRQPAALCGVYGFKPTYGRVSRYGLVAFASSLDQIGPLGRNLRDMALLMDVIGGHDQMDSTSLEVQPNFAATLEHRPQGFTVGVVKEAMQLGNSEGVAAALQRFQEVLEAEGVRFVEVSIPSLEYALATYYLVCTSEASSNLARYDGTLYGLRVEGVGVDETMRKTRAAGFGPEVKRRILMGTFALSSGYYDAYYGKALRARARLKADFERALTQADVLLTPTSPFPAFPLGVKLEDPLAMYLSDIDTVAVNLVGFPALAIPAGFEAGLPVGVQLVGKPLEDERLFALAQVFEQATAAEFVQTAPIGRG
ncbi:MULTISPECIES: Asp-tRNA(Asn)/Glu-tRNA(Gln) amidotransferase subunit GatA [unclassified Meiothermus]|uniref:Asp-tRNA(Asn)/Glu-tRNA(Gln) amidotransferase subunit GatA n=1 Tax=unclassified Meiothermus TaxID=370471 RepID=UPI000D7C9D91|nr:MULTISPECIES: Asp-tRNA(Asn)/Glu-tRNA(Gln) amidotransferase subunit GatA [unclassified Meiothermus]PZA06524.1 Asp-tRNA(Asn)/Glu-tRNA(Gln) amidotransferase GatCAB subunit A [Meiothermus sp. Pnk-1]RYM37199.1 Asp-tRNA(Asn)/Glu-tRNA(Gln) amidotransferase subunit GatA [Meiothermus sp. PNK-Is4]